MFRTGFLPSSGF